MIKCTHWRWEVSPHSAKLLCLMLSASPNACGWAALNRLREVLLRLAAHGLEIFCNALKPMVEKGAKYAADALNSFLSDMWKYLQQTSPRVLEEVHPHAPFRPQSASRRRLQISVHRSALPVPPRRRCCSIMCSVPFGRQL